MTAPAPRLTALDALTAPRPRPILGEHHRPLALAADLVTVSDLVRFIQAHGLAELSRLRWIGPKSLKQITDLLAGLDEDAGVKTFVAADGQVLRGEPVSITDLLAGFRAKLEGEAEAPIEALDLNAALLLSDLCNHLGLSTENRHRVLGDRAAVFVQRVQDERPALRLSPQALVPPDGGVRVWLN